MVVFVLLACAEPPAEKKPVLLWPMPPERPRVSFEDIILGSLDVLDESKFRDVIFGTREEVRFNKPVFVAVRDNRVYVSDIGMVHMYDFNEKKFSVIGRGAFVTPTGIDVTSDRTLYVADSSLRRVFIMGYGAKEVKFVGELGDFMSPAGLAVDEENGRVLVADSRGHSVSVYTLEGEKLFKIGKRGTEDGEFNFPYDVEVGKDGEFYVIDSGNFRVQVFDEDGKFLRKFGAVGAAPAHFARPKSISVDSDMHIYVVDSAFGNFQIFDGEGRLFLSVGTTGVDAGMFSLPFGIDIDERDRIYVVDQMNNRIQVFQYIKYPDE